MDYELIAKALFESFETIYDIDLETSAYKCFHESEDYKKLKLEKSGDNFFEALPSGVEEIIAEDDREYVLEMLSRDNLVRGLQEDKYYTFIYRIKRNGKEVYHQITATLQPTEEGTHVYMGVKNIDNLMQREIRHRAELSSLQQKEANHMKAVLASSAAYMEINLSKDLVLEKSDDITAVEKRFIKRIPSLEEIPRYSDLHDWICENLVVENEKQYREVGSPEALLNHFYGGTLRASVLFSISTKEGGILPCREVFLCDLRPDRAAEKRAGEETARTGPPHEQDPEFHKPDATAFPVQCPGIHTGGDSDGSGIRLGIAGVFHGPPQKLHQGHDKGRTACLLAGTGECESVCQYREDAVWKQTSHGIRYEGHPVLDPAADHSAPRRECHPPRHLWKRTGRRRCIRSD